MTSPKQNNQTVSCSLCPEKAYRKLSIGTVEHDFCAFHGGFVMALEGLFKKHHSHWSSVNDS